MTGPLVAPGGVLGILGGGQLGRMLALAAARLGIACHIYCPDAGSPAFQVAHRVTCAPYEDEAALDRFAAGVGAVTYEFENVPAASAVHLGARRPVLPPVSVLETTADRLVEKRFVRALGIGTAGFRPVDGPGDLMAALADLGRPAVLKTRRFGYDGHGQAVIGPDTSPEEALARMGGQPAILEAFVPFRCEVSVVAARGRDGALVLYDVVENRHEGGILRVSTVPAGVGAAVADRARAIATAIIAALGHVGVLAVEMFVTEAGEVLVNEIAPRVHNSGHWTTDACVVGQFENHVRAVCGWPLGEPARHSDAVMTNLLGEDAGAALALATEPGAALHLYGKAEARPGRKMGHVTLLTPRRDAASPAG